jgi:hypothetical protein
MALILLLGLFLTNLGGVVLAESRPALYPIPPVPSDTSSSLLFGQKHSYSVVFRGNGEAITYAKIVIPNREEQALTDFSFEIPNVEAYEVSMYQMKLPPECVRYNYSDSSNTCLEYRDPDYGQDYYYYGSGQSAEYKKIPYTQTGSSYKLNLPNPVEASKSTAIIVSYATKGYVDQSFGIYKFNFETIKVNSRIQSTKVAIDVDSDVFLKGKQSSVNYNTTGSAASVPKLGDASAISSRELDSVVSNIGSYGAIIKEGKSLAPNESFNVKGEYAKNRFLLYINEIIITLVILVAIVVSIYFLSKYINSKHKKGSDNTISSQDKVRHIVDNTSINLFNVTNVLISLGSVIGVIIVNILLRVVNYYNIWQSISYDPTFGSLISVITNLLYALILLAPAIMVGLRRGWGNALSIIILQFIWFILLFSLYLILFQTGMAEVTPMPRPLY